VTVRALLRGEGGQAATELIVILPVFLILAFGVAELVKSFNYWVDETHLAGEVGRFVAGRVPWLSAAARRYRAVRWENACPVCAQPRRSGASEQQQRD